MSSRQAPPTTRRWRPMRCRPGNAVGSWCRRALGSRAALATGFASRRVQHSPSPRRAYNAHSPVTRKERTWAPPELTDRFGPRRLRTALRCLVAPSIPADDRDREDGRGRSGSSRRAATTWPTPRPAIARACWFRLEGPRVPRDGRRPTAAGQRPGGDRPPVESLHRRLVTPARTILLRLLRFGMPASASCGGQNSSSPLAGIKLLLGADPKREFRDDVARSALGKAEVQRSPALNWQPAPSTPTRLQFDLANVRLREQHPQRPSRPSTARRCSFWTPRAGISK